MSKRFTRFFMSERNLYIEGCPVVVEGSALLKDNENNKLLAQIKFKNLSSKIIKGLSVKLKLFDNANRELSEITEYTYLDLSFVRDGTYGDKVPVHILDYRARAFKICISEVVFKDNSIYQSDSFDLKPIKAPQFLSSYFDNDTDLEEQYSLECNAVATYVPTKDRDLWICTCGGINRKNEESCHICRCNLTNSIEKLDKTHLKANYEERMKEEMYCSSLKHIGTNDISVLKKALKSFTELDAYKDSKEIATECKNKIEKLEAKIAKTRKRNKKIAIVSMGIITASICIYVLSNNVIIPNVKYNNAIFLMNDKKYQEAIEVFDSISDYENSAELENQCYLEGAKQFYSNKEYLNAINWYEKVNSYDKNADFYVESCYNHGLKQIDSGYYISAISYLKKARDYKSAKELIKTAKYKYVITHKNTEDDKTFEYLKELKDAGYMNSTEIYKELYRWEVTVIANSDSKDETTNKTTISKYDPIYFHYKVTGGEPNKKILVYCEITSPNGSTNSGGKPFEIYVGANSYLGWGNGVYSNPAYGAEGKLRIKFYDPSGSLIGEGSVNITS